MPWVYNGVTTTVIGLIGPEHTRNDGYRLVFSFQLNKAGQVRGYSQRFNGRDFFGYSAWLYNGTTTIDIGLNDAEYTRGDGYKYSRNEQLNEADRFVDTPSDSVAARIWARVPGSTMGLERLTSASSASNILATMDANTAIPKRLDEAGMVSGYSYRWSGGSTYLGRSAWLYNGATTIDVGLTGCQYTRNDGYKESFADHLNEAGEVTGRSMLFDGGSTPLGQSAWLYDGVATIDIGLNDIAHTRDDGYKYSLAEDLNEVGRVTGYSRRYKDGSAELGQDAWFYDPTLNETLQFQLSNRSDGYAYSAVTYFDDDGLVLGEYHLFDALDNDLGLRAFYFTVSDGLHDLGSLVDGGLAANDWDLLASTFRVNAHGQILGQGKLTSQSDGQMAYLLTPVVPEPSTLFLATCGAVGWLSIRRSANVHQIGSRGVRA